MFVNVLMTLVAICAVAYLAFRLFAYKQGDAVFQFKTDKRTPFQLEEVSFRKAVFVTDVPFGNIGKQGGTIMDCYPRHLMPCEQFCKCRITSWITHLENERHDGYWESYIFLPGEGGTLRLRVELESADGNIRDDLSFFPDMPVDVVYQVVARSDWYIAKCRVTLTADEVLKALQGGVPEWTA